VKNIASRLRKARLKEKLMAVTLKFVRNKMLERKVADAGILQDIEFYSCEAGDVLYVISKPVLSSWYLASVQKATSLPLSKNVATFLGTDINEDIELPTFKNFSSAILAAQDHYNATGGKL
jgi:hypothetical protein